MVSAQHQHRRAVATFTSRQEAEQGLELLYGAGFPLTSICVVSKYSELIEQLKQSLKNNNLAEDIRNNHFRYQGQVGNTPCAMITGSLLGAIGGCLASIGVLSIPGVAPTLAIGATVGTALASTLTGAGIGLAGGGLLSACTCAGTNQKRARWDDRPSPEEYLVMVSGTDEELRRAEILLSEL